jgi:hypothetical protein
VHAERPRRLRGQPVAQDQRIGAHVRGDRSQQGAVVEVALQRREQAGIGGQRLGEDHRRSARRPDAGELHQRIVGTGGDPAPAARRRGLRQFGADGVEIGARRLVEIDEVDEDRRRRMRRPQQVLDRFPLVGQRRRIGPADPAQIGDAGLVEIDHPHGVLARSAIAGGIAAGEHTLIDAVGRAIGRALHAERVDHRVQIDQHRGERADQQGLEDDPGGQRFPPIAPFATVS